jgi:hypothetical protein
MKLAKTGRKIALAFEPWRAMEFALMALLWTSGWFVVSVIVFLRKDFGERYLSWLNLFFGYVVVGVFTESAVSIFGGANGNHISMVMASFYVTFIGLSILHRRVISKRNKAGSEWHSLYSGTPLLPIPVTTETMNKWIEPAILAAGGAVMGLFHVGLISIWLFVSAFALALHEQISYHLQRDQFLDLRDAGIEAKYWQAAMSGRSAVESRGFTIAASNVELIHKTPGMTEIFANLAPELRAIMDTAEAA